MTLAFWPKLYRGLTIADGRGTARVAEVVIARVRVLHGGKGVAAQVAAVEAGRVVGLRVVAVDAVAAAQAVLLQLHQRLDLVTLRVGPVAAPGAASAATPATPIAS